MRAFQENEVQRNSNEEKYNNIHKKCRATIERANGQLTGLFRWLNKNRMFHYNPQFVSLIAIASCVPYNICEQLNLNERDVHKFYVEEARPIPINVNEKTIENVILLICNDKN